MRPAKPDIFPFANSGPLKNWWTQSEEFLVLGEWEGEDLGPPETSTPFLYQILSTCLCGGSFLLMMMHTQPMMGSLLLFETVSDNRYCAPVVYVVPMPSDWVPPSLGSFPSLGYAVAGGLSRFSHSWASFHQPKLLRKWGWLPLKWSSLLLNMGYDAIF